MQTWLLWSGYRDDAPVAWELFAGVVRWTAAMAAAGWATLRPIDIAQGPDDNLIDPQTLRIVMAVIRGGYVTLVHLGPPCTTFSYAVTPPRRSEEFPKGIPGLAPEVQAVLDEGFSLLQIAF